MNIPDDLARELLEELPMLMHRYDRYDNGSDYECSFCSMRPKTNKDDIVHSAECLGVLLTEALSKDE